MILDLMGQQRGWYIFHSRHLLRPQQDVRRHAGAPQVYGAYAIRKVCHNQSAGNGCDALPFFKYGIYKCRITNPHNVSTRLLHYADAREIGLCITMMEGKDNALLYADGRERETKPRCKKRSCTVCGWIDHAEQHRGGSEQGKAPGFAAPGDYSHGQYVVNLHDYLPEVQSVPIMLGWARSSHRLHDGRCTSQDVYRVHTDGVVMSKPMEELPLGDGVGEWKVEKGGACEVVNANVVE